MLGCVDALIELAWAMTRHWVTMAVRRIDFWRITEEKEITNVSVII